MGAQWAGVDENIGTKMYWKLVDDNSGEIICRSTIRSTIEPGTANLQVDPLEPLPDPIDDTKHDDLLDDLMSLANFNAPLSHTTKTSPVDYIPASKISQTWQDIKRGVEHNKDTQQRHFHSIQSKSHS